MVNILYVDDKYESLELIYALDEQNVDYELHSAAEARELGYYNLPILVVDGKKLEYKKAIRKAKRGDIR